MKQIRQIFLLGLTLFSLAFIYVITEQYLSEKERVEQRLEYRNDLIAEATRSSLQGLDALLRVLGQELIDRGTLDEPENGRALIEAAASSTLKMAGYGLARKDGQLVLISGLPSDQTLPNLNDSPLTREGLERALNSDTLQLGQPYWMKQLGVWVIPMRVALRDSEGAILGVMTAGLKATDTGLVWQNLNLTDFNPPLTTTLLHGKGYVQFYDRPDLNEEDSRAIYETPLSPVIQGMLAARANTRGIEEVQLPEGQQVFRSEPAAKNIVAYRHLPDTDLYVVTFIRKSDWLSSVLIGFIPEFSLSLLVLIIGFSGYRYAAKRQVQHEEKIHYLARHDQVTGLPNRNQLVDRVKTAINICSQTGARCSLITIDTSQSGRIDSERLQRIDDTYTKAVAKLLHERIGQGDILARVGEHRFAILQTELGTSRDSGDAINRFSEMANQKVRLHASDIRISPFVGWSTYPEDATDAETLLITSLSASSQARELNADLPIRYSTDLDESARRRVELDTELATAIEQGRIEVYYQPKIAPKTGSCFQFEALARWSSETFGFVSPDEFIAIAESSGSIHALGILVLETSIRDAASMQQLFGRPVTMSVNLSAKQFTEPDLAQRIKQVLDKHQYDCGNLVVEVTESVMIQDIQQAVETMKALRALGIGISIDDFGTGFSSLSYINKMPITELKIDRSFVMDIGRDASDLSLTKSIIALGKSIGVSVVAEGVETADHVRVLSELECDYLQGYYYSPPKPLPEIVKFCKERQAQLSQEEC